MIYPSPSRFDRWLGIIMGHARSVLKLLFAPLPSKLASSLLVLSEEFLAFGIKQAWACLFGGLILAAIILTHFFYPENASIARYDFLFLYAISLQIMFLLTKMEHLPEAVVILIFHIVGTGIEIFKTDVGSWTYPEENFFRIGGVPLFSGFMYAAVGSYLARVMRIFDFSFNIYPQRRYTLLLACLIYLNFFTHHYFIDIRLGLFALTAFIFWPTFVSYQCWQKRLSMPLLVGFFLVAIFLWIAENIGTFTGTWLYPNQAQSWKPVSLQKMGSWYLLMILSFVLTTIVHTPKAKRIRFHESQPIDKTPS